MEMMMKFKKIRRSELEASAGTVEKGREDG
jgi:hypothetical protein